MRYRWFIFMRRDSEQTCYSRRLQPRSLLSEEQRLGGDGGTADNVQRNPQKIGRRLRVSDQKALSAPRRKEREEKERVTRVTPLYIHCHSFIPQGRDENTHGGACSGADAVEIRRGRTEKFRKKKKRKEKREKERTGGEEKRGPKRETHQSRALLPRSSYNELSASLLRGNFHARRAGAANKATVRRRVSP